MILAALADGTGHVDLRALVGLESRDMRSSRTASLLYAASSHEAGESRSCWATARRTARFIVDEQILPCEELAFSKHGPTSVGVSRFLCNSRGKLRDQAMILVDLTKLPRHIARRMKELAAAGTVKTGTGWR